MQNKGFRYICFKCHGFLFFSPHGHQKTFLTLKSNELYHHLSQGKNKPFICLWNDLGSVPWPHYALPECERNREMGWRSRIIQSKTLLLQHWQTSEARPCMSRTPLFLTPLSLSPGANPLYMPCSSAITMTQFLLKTVFPKLQKEPVLVQELSRETVPLSLTMRAAESYSRKCFVRNFW